MMIASLGCHALTVMTALTGQDTVGVPWRQGFYRERGNSFQIVFSGRAEKKRLAIHEAVLKVFRCRKKTMAHVNSRIYLKE